MVYENENNSLVIYEPIDKDRTISFRTTSLTEYGFDVQMPEEDVKVLIAQLQKWVGVPGERAPLGRFKIMEIK